MNVLITNNQESILSGLNIEIIKTLRGEYDAEELIGIFANFFFGRMILDLTSVRKYDDISNLQKLSISLPVDKIILLVPANTKYAENAYLSKLISMGYYNFTTNLEGVEYLLANPNSYKDVAHLHQLETAVIQVPAQTQTSSMPQMKGPLMSAPQEIQAPVIRVIGFKNVTDSAGATTLIYMMKKELEQFHGLKVKAIEISKRDFSYFRDKSLVSVSKNEYIKELSNSSGVNLILVDVNDMSEQSFNEIIYLIEPSIIKINKLVRRDQRAFEKLKGQKVVLNKSMISNDEIGEFAAEAGVDIFAAVRPFNDRSNQAILTSFLNRLGVISVSNDSK